MAAFCILRNPARPIQRSVAVKDACGQQILEVNQSFFKWITNIAGLMTELVCNSKVKRMSPRAKYNQPTILEDAIGIINTYTI